MRTKKLVGAACALAMLVGLTATHAVAQTLDERTFFTFNGPVDIPGVGLQPGKYMFRIADPNGDRHVVQVLSADGKRVFAMFFSRAAQRATAANDPEVRFMETPEGAPPAVKTWWYPGERTGREFVYPKDQARRIAERAHEPVLTTRQASTRTEETNTTDLARISPGGSETDVSDNNTLTQGNPSGSAQKGNRAPESIATPVSKSPVKQLAQARTELPRTASTLPWVMSFGVFLLATAGALRLWRLRIA